MKGIIAFISVIALLPMSAIASPDPLGMPFCYMVRSDGRVINLDRMCNVVIPKNTQTTLSSAESDVDEVCNALALEAYNAPTQFLKDRAQKNLEYCRNNKASLQRTFRDIGISR